MKYHVLIAVVICLIIPAQHRPTDAVPEGLQGVQVVLRSEITNFQLDADDFGHALISFAARFNLTAGIEWVRSAETMKKINLSWRKASVEPMLDALISTQPGYQLEISDGILHVFPSAINSSSQNFLNLKIDKFELRNQVVEIGSHKLHDQVRARISPAQTGARREAGVGSSQATSVGDPEFSLALENVSVRQVLDSLAVASDRKIWVVTFTSGSNPTATKYFRTATLWNNADVSDVDQPAWDMFRWSDSIPPS